MNLMLGAAHSVFFYINIVLITILVLMIGTQLYWFVRSKISGNVIDGEEFAKGIHRGQVVDLRDENKFKKDHMLGARNMPFMQFKMYKDALRKDMPVYLYDEGVQYPIKVSSKLKKEGFKEVYILKGGYSAWEGKKKGRKFLLTNKKSERYFGRSLFNFFSFGEQNDACALRACDVRLKLLRVPRLVRQRSF